MSCCDSAPALTRTVARSAQWQTDQLANVFGRVSWWRLTSGEAWIAAGTRGRGLWSALIETRTSLSASDCGPVSHSVTPATWRPATLAVCQIAVRLSDQAPCCSRGRSRKPVGESSHCLGRSSNCAVGGSRHSQSRPSAVPWSAREIAGRLGHAMPPRPRMSTWDVASRTPQPRRWTGKQHKFVVATPQNDEVPGQCCSDQALLCNSQEVEVAGIEPASFEPD